MTRPTLAVSALLCALLAGCPAEEPDMGVAEAPAHAEKAPAANPSVNPAVNPDPVRMSRAEIEASVVGERVADLGATWLHGAPATVGGTQLVVFFESWCPHCKREVPKLSATYDKFRGKGLTMVGLTKQTRNVTDDAVREFVNAQGVTYPIAKEDSGIPNWKEAPPIVPAKKDQVRADG